MEIAIGGGKVALVDDADAAAVAGIKWWARKGPASETFYATASGGRQMHRLIMGAARGQVVDHRNHNGLDNRRENLRLCTNAENLRNRLPNKVAVSRFKGVKRGHRNRWRAVIQVDGERFSLGAFETEELAARQYDRAARLMHGEFALTNEMIDLYAAQPR